MELSRKNSTAIRVAIASLFHSSTGPTRQDGDESLRTMLIRLQGNRELSTREPLAQGSRATDQRRARLRYDWLQRGRAISTWEDEGGAPLHATAS